MTYYSLFLFSNHPSPYSFFIFTSYLCYASPFHAVSSSICPLFSSCPFLFLFLSSFRTSLCPPPMLSLPFLCHSLHLDSQGEALETVTTAAVCLFSTQTQLADQVPPLGHLPRIIAALNHKNNAVPKSSIRLIHVLSENEVRYTFSQTPTVFSQCVSKNVFAEQPVVTLVIP